MSFTPESLARLYEMGAKAAETFKRIREECPWCYDTKSVRLRDGLGGDRTVPCPACAPSLPLPPESQT